MKSPQNTAFQKYFNSIGTLKCFSALCKDVLLPSSVVATTPVLDPSSPLVLKLGLVTGHTGHIDHNTSFRISYTV